MDVRVVVININENEVAIPKINGEKEGLLGKME
ncbi:unnamed protein product, partial [marine sediment metagenome]